MKANWSKFSRYLKWIWLRLKATRHDIYDKILFLLIPVLPEQPVVLDRWGRQLNSTKIGPMQEGEDIILSCRVVGGEKVYWWGLFEFCIFWRIQNIDIFPGTFSAFPRDIEKLLIFLDSTFKLYLRAEIKTSQFKEIFSLHSSNL